jgi:hypothetical protein
MSNSKRIMLTTLLFTALVTLPGVVLFLPIYSLPHEGWQTTAGAWHEWYVLMGQSASDMVAVLGRDFVVGAAGPLWIFLFALTLCLLASGLALLVPAISNFAGIRKISALVVGFNLFLLFVFSGIYLNFHYLSKGSGLILVMFLSITSTICAIAVFFSKRVSVRHT